VINTNSHPKEQDLTKPCKQRGFLIVGVVDLSIKKSKKDNHHGIQY